MKTMDMNVPVWLEIDLYCSLSFIKWCTVFTFVSYKYQIACKQQLYHIFSYN